MTSGTASSAIRVVLVTGLATGGTSKNYPLFKPTSTGPVGIATTDAAPAVSLGNARGVLL